MKSYEEVQSSTYKWKKHWKVVQRSETSPSNKGMDQDQRKIQL